MDTLDTMRAVLLLAATLFAGVTAGLFLLYAHTVMPGLGATDDRTFVGAFQAIDRKVDNWFVFTALFGGPVLANLAQVRAGFREPWWRTWNVVRCATATAAFASLAWSLFLLGRQL